jgi:hypothetical protein
MTAPSFDRLLRHENRPAAAVPYHRPGDPLIGDAIRLLREIAPYCLPTTVRRFGYVARDGSLRRRGTETAKLFLLFRDKDEPARPRKIRRLIKVLNSIWNHNVL